MWWNAHSRINPLGRLSRWVLLIAMSIAGSLIGARIAPLTSASWFVVAVGTAVGWLLGELFLSGWFRFAALVQSSGTVAKTQFGSHSLRVDAEGLSETGPAGTVTRGWAAFERIMETKEHLFLVLAGGAAYVVPRATLPADTLGALKQEIASQHPTAWKQRCRMHRMQLTGSAPARNRGPAADPGVLRISGSLLDRGRVVEDAVEALTDR